MNRTFAVVIVAAVALCLSAIERLTAAPPAAPPAAPAAPCAKCCEKSCCKDKAKAAATLAAAIKQVSAQTVSAEEAECCGSECADGAECKGQCADGQCCKGDEAAAKGKTAFDIDLTLPIPPLAPPTISFTASNSSCPGATCEHSACAGDCPSAASATCTENKTIHYSAIPAPVASPFAKSALGLPSIAPAQPVLSTAPSQPWTISLPQPPILQTSADIYSPQPVPSRTACSLIAAEPVKTSQVQFNIQVIEDRQGCLAEYESFQNGDCMMFADTNTLLPALRILQKHQLVGIVAEPRLICITGQRAQMQVGNEVAAGDKPRWQGVKVDVEAEQYESGLKVDFAVHAADDEHTCDVRTAVLLEEGQSIILKSQTSTACDKETDCCCKPATYVVLTPELVK